MSNSKDKNQRDSELEDKIKDIFEEGVKVLKEGIFGLEVMASKTVEATKLSLDKQSLQKKIKSDLSCLGEIFFEKLKNSQAKSIKLTSEISDLIKEIKGSQKKLIQLNKKIQNYSSVQRGSKEK